MAKIRDLAKACKSKNAGPYELTLDIMFGDRDTFDKVRRSGVISRALFARLYNVPESSVLLTEFPPAFALPLVPPCPVPPAFALPLVPLAPWPLAPWPLAPWPVPPAFALAP